MRNGDGEAPEAGITAGWGLWGCSGELLMVSVGVLKKAPRGEGARG